MDDRSRSNSGLSAFLLLLLCSTTSVTSQNCSDSDRDRCEDHISPFLSTIEYSVIVPATTEDEMLQHCREYDDVQACVSEFKHRCPLADVAVFRGRDDAYDWLCREAFDEYLEHTDCFALPQLHDEGRICNVTLHAGLDRITEEGLTGDAYRRRLCQTVNNYLDCVENAVTAECDARAAAWQRTMDYRLLRPLLSLVACRLDNDGHVITEQASSSEEDVSSRTYIVIGCLAVLTVVIAVVFILLCRMLRKQRKQREATSRRSMTSAHYNYADDAVYVGAVPTASAGPLPQKMPEPPPYDTQPPPQYARSIDVDRASGRYATAAPTVVASLPPDYRSQAGSVRSN